MNTEFAEFATRDVFEGGIKVPLSRPDGTKTDKWIVVRNYRCDAYQTATATIRRRIAESGGTPTIEQLNDDHLTRLAALVGDWSLSTPCTPENVKAFLRDAQLVAEAIDRISTEDDRFFAQGSGGSTPGPSPK